jgi:hypothetical protein
VEARWAHNPKVAGSNPAPATKEIRALAVKSWRFFVFIPEKSYNGMKYYYGNLEFPFFRSLT